MASISDVIDECLTVATAYTDISSSAYEELGAVNWDDNDKNFPYLLIDKRSLSVEVDKYSRTKLPASSTYTLSFYFFNTFTESEKASTDLQTKQATLMDYADKYFAEVKSRNESGANGLYLSNEGVTFTSLDEMQNDRLIQLSYTVEFIVKQEGCNLGSFNY